MAPAPRIMASGMLPAVAWAANPVEVEVDALLLESLELVVSVASLVEPVLVVEAETPTFSVAEATKEE